MGISLGELPNDVLYNIFKFVPKRTFRAYSFVQKFEWNWLNIMCTCKRFVKIGQRAFNVNLKTLLWACKQGQSNLVRDLLNDRRIKFSNLDEPKQALIYATNSGNLETLKTLMDDKRILSSFISNRPNEDSLTLIGNLLLDAAVCNSHIEIVRFLLKIKTLSTFLVSKVFVYGCSKNSNLPIITELYNDGRVVNPSHDCLDAAVQSGDINIVRFLLTIPSIDPTKGKALEISKRRGYNLITEELLKNEKIIQFVMENPKLLDMISSSNNRKVQQELFDDGRF